MCKNKVVITGIGAVSPFGWGLTPLMQGLKNGRCSIGLLGPEDAVGGMSAQLGGKAPEYDLKCVPREYRRSMPKVALMALMAASEALQMAGIEATFPLEAKFTDAGVSIGTTLGSSQSLDSFFSDFLPDHSVEKVRGTMFFKVMSHTVPSNLAMAFGLKGRCLAPAAACAAGLQAIGLAYESIAAGYENAMLCGGAEEFHALLPATFDRLGAASLSAVPDEASRPFDTQRNGIVCSEGAGILLLESEKRAKNRGADILGEVLSFASNTSPSSIISPDSGAIYDCMAEALEKAGLSSRDITLVNAHATATEHGDIAEGQAIAKLFGDKTPVNSLKGYMGHAMAASGAIELIATLLAARENIILPTRNLDVPDPRCGELHLFTKQLAYSDFFNTKTDNPHGYLLKNSFGLGGINSSVVLKIEPIIIS